MRRPSGNIERARKILNEFWVLFEFEIYEETIVREESNSMGNVNSECLQVIYLRDKSCQLKYIKKLRN